MFGHVSDGMDVVKKIEQTATRNDKPVAQVTISACREIKNEEEEVELEADDL